MAQSGTNEAANRPAHGATGPGHLEHGDRLMEEGRPLEAADAYACALRAGEPPERARIGRGVAALVGGDPSAALQLFKEAAAHSPQSARAHFGLGLARLELGYARGARHAFAQCLNYEPDHVNAISQLVRAAFATHDYVCAEGYLCEYVARNPEAHDMRFTLSGLQLLGGRARAAERTLDELLVREPSYPDTAPIRERMIAHRASDGDAEPCLRSRFVVAVIPARGGSKGIPRKNLRELAGKPLIAHTIDAARHSKLCDVVVVSTEDAEIARVARDFGAEVVMRPAELATDEAPTEPTLLHAVAAIEDRHEATADVVVLLQATSPLRPASAIDAAVRRLCVDGCDSVVAVRSDHGAHFTGVVREGRFVPPYDPQARRRRQDMEPLYRETGALYAVTRNLLFASKCRMGGDMRPLVLSEEEAMDIDTASDFALVERFIERRSRT